jgi:hypothetical protein
MTIKIWNRSNSWIRPVLTSLPVRCSTPRGALLHLESRCSPRSGLDLAMRVTNSVRIRHSKTFRGEADSQSDFEAEAPLAGVGPR